jgi:hypothetical protein
LATRYSNHHQDEVVAETFTIVKDMSSGGSNFRTPQKFKKK